ncbi:MAG: tRNA 2-thiocytidine(32) synthetase TtcA [Bdellovibrionales bacterium]
MNPPSETLVPPLKSNPVDLTHPLAERIRREIARASHDFNMIEDGDRVLVCVSGGKDSSILLALLTEIQRRAALKFELEAVILDQKQPGFQVEEFRRFIEALGVKLTVLERDTYSIVTEKIQDGVYCSLCSRLRRAILYDYAFEKGFTKMALGHHRDDLIETTLLNLFYSGSLASMPPKLLSDDGRNVIIRPLAYVPERLLKELSQVWQFPIIPCNLCGSQDGLKRKKMKALVHSLEKEIPNLGSAFLNALSNVRPSQLMDQNLWNFKDLKGEIQKRHES